MSIVGSAAAVLLSADARADQVSVLASERRRVKPGPVMPASGVLLPRRDHGRPEAW